MPTKESCRTCKHCLNGQLDSGAWCRLRQFAIHPEMALVAFCHHWTQKAPSLPKLENTNTDHLIDKQLELGRALVAHDH